MQARPGIFGWSLPPGVSRLPGEDVCDGLPPRCEKCGAFVPFEPAGGEPYTGDNPHLTSHLWWDCRKCGHRTETYE